MTSDTNVPGPGNREYQRAPGEAAATPKDLKVQIKQQRLTIEWADGKRSEFALPELRRRCPCATCRTERAAESDNPLKILKSDPTGVRVTSASLVGNYAIKLIWSDGHDTGIFEFRVLRMMADSTA